METKRRLPAITTPPAVLRPLPPSSAAGAAAGALSAASPPGDASRPRLVVRPPGQPVPSACEGLQLLALYPERDHFTSSRPPPFDQTGTARKALGEVAGEMAARRATLEATEAQAVPAGGSRLLDRKAAVSAGGLGAGALPRADAASLGYSALVSVLFGADARAAQDRWIELVTQQAAQVQAPGDPTSVCKALMSLLVRTPCPAGLPPAAHAQRLAELARVLSTSGWEGSAQTRDHYSALLEAITAAQLPAELEATLVGAFARGIGLGTEEAAGRWLARTFLDEDEWTAQDAQQVRRVFNTLVRALLVATPSADAKAGPGVHLNPRVLNFIHDLQRACQSWEEPARASVFTQVARSMMAHLDNPMGESLLRQLVVHPDRPLLTMLSMKALSREAAAAGSAAMDQRLRDLFLCADADFWCEGQDLFHPSSLMHMAIGHAEGQQDDASEDRALYKSLKASAVGLPAKAWRSEDHKHARVPAGGGGGGGGGPAPAKDDGSPSAFGSPTLSEARQLWAASLQIAQRPYLALQLDVLYERLPPLPAVPPVATAAYWLVRALPMDAPRMFALAVLARMPDDQGLGHRSLDSIVSLFRHKDIAPALLAPVLGELEALAPQRLTPGWHEGVAQLRGRPAAGGEADEGESGESSVATSPGVMSPPAAEPGGPVDPGVLSFPAGETADD